MLLPVGLHHVLLSSVSMAIAASGHDSDAVRQEWQQQLKLKSGSATTRQHAHTRYCPSAQDLTVAYAAPRKPTIRDRGWTFRGGGGVATKSSFNLLGGYVEYDLDLSETAAGVNANIYSISPKSFARASFNKSAGDYCDGGGKEYGPGYCLEVDWVESNGRCGGASALHAVPGRSSSRVPLGCNAAGCRLEYVYNSTPAGVVHMRVEYDQQGHWTQIVEGKAIAPSEWVPLPNASDWSVVHESYSKFGAVVYSSHWMGWAPCPAPCGCNNCSANPQNCTDILASSLYSVHNLEIYGTVMQGPTPTTCRGVHGGVNEKDIHTELSH